AIHQPTPADARWRENSRQRIRRAERVRKPSAREPDLVTCTDLGRDSSELEGKILDEHAFGVLDQATGEASAADQTGTAQAEIEIAKNAPARQRARPFLELGELVDGIKAARHRADRGAGDDVGLDAVPDKRAQHADVGKAARGAAAEREPDRELLFSVGNGLAGAVALGRAF